VFKTEPIAEGAEVEEAVDVTGVDADCNEDKPLVEVVGESVGADAVGEVVGLVVGVVGEGLAVTEETGDKDDNPTAGLDVLFVTGAVGADGVGGVTLAVNVLDSPDDGVVGLDAGAALGIKDDRPDAGTAVVGTGGVLSGAGRFANGSVSTGDAGSF